MTTRPRYVLICIAAMACAQNEQPEPAQNEQAVSTAQTGENSPECWSRAQGAELAGRESPLDSATIDVNGRSIKLCYSRPRMRTRTIFGGLVPYGAPWRLGANEATVIHMPGAGSIAGVSVEPGSYSLYAVPDSTQWQIVVNRRAQRWGIPVDAQVMSDNIGSGVVPTQATEQPVDALTARFEPGDADSVTLVFQWERTLVRVPIRLIGS